MSVLGGNQMTNKVKGALLVLSISAVLAAGCSGNNGKTSNTGQPTESPTGQKSEQEAYTLVDGYPKFDPPVKLSQNFIIPTGGENWFAPGHDIKNNKFVEWSKDKLGIEWEAQWVVPDGDADLQKLNLAMASRQLPNIVKTNSSQIIKLAKAGLLLPLDELIEQYASPLVKFLIQEANDSAAGQLFAAVTYDGKIYAMPTIIDTWAGTNNTHWIRKDILDSLGLPVPETLEQFEKTMEAYKRKHPDGTGLYMENWGGHLSGTEIVFNALGAFPGRWQEDPANPGQLIYGSLQPEFRQGLEILQGWYAKGYINKEFIVKKNYQDFIAGKALSLYGSWALIHGPFIDTVKNNPEAVIVPVPLFRESEKSSFISGFPFADGTGITVGTKNPEAVILAFNEYMESVARADLTLRDKFKFKYEAEEGGFLEGYKKEGPGYWNFPGAKSIEEVDGVHLVFGMKMNQRSTELIDTYIRINNAIKDGKEDQLSSSDKLRMQEVRDRLNEYGHNLHIDLYQKQKAMGLYDRMDAFFGTPTTTMLEKSTFLSKLQEESMVKIIMNSEPISYFDSFTSQWLKSGGEQIVKEVNEWYAAK